MNYIWIFLILISIIIGAVNGKLDLVVNAMFDSTKKAIDITLYLIGIMAFWVGLMKVAEKTGLMKSFSKLIAPLIQKIFPDVPKGNKALGFIAMNFSANALGLSNASTPFGLKAMEELQEINKNKKTASNSMCMLLAMNTAGFQLIPATVLAVLAANGSTNPTEIIAPTLLVTSIAFISAILIAKIFEKHFPKQDMGETNDY